MGFAKVDIAKLTTFKEMGFEPNCVFDVGASNGLWSRNIGPLFKKADFHLFEPLAGKEPGYNEYLDPILESHGRFKLHQVALGRTEGNVVFQYLKNSPSGSTLMDVSERPQRFEQISVPQITLDGLIDRGEATVPGLVKMDIQGAELEALRGFRKYLPQVELLLLETWLSRNYGPQTPLVHELMNFLAPFGFYLFDISDSYRDKNQNLIAPDLFFVNENSVLAQNYSF